MKTTVSSFSFFQWEIHSFWEHELPPRKVELWVTNCLAFPQIASTANRHFSLLLNKSMGGNYHVRIIGGENGEKEEKYSRHGCTRTTIVYVAICTLTSSNIFYCQQNRVHFFSFAFQVETVMDVKVKVSFEDPCWGKGATQFGLGSGYYFPALFSPVESD